MESVVNDNPDAENPEVPDMSKTLTSTIVGEHEHTIVGYSLLKGIGDGEPIASDRFTVGGHEWVLLFYPDGKKSSSEAAHHAHPNLLGHFGHHGRTQTMRQTMRQFASAMAAGDAPMTQEEARQAQEALRVNEEEFPQRVEGSDLVRQLRETNSTMSDELAEKKQVCNSF